MSKSCQSRHDLALEAHRHMEAALLKLDAAGRADVAPNLDHAITRLGFRDTGTTDTMYCGLLTTLLDKSITPHALL